MKFFKIFKKCEKIKKYFRGHNGLRSLINYFDSKDFSRLMIGTGRPDSKEKNIVRNWVLGKFPETDLLRYETEIFPKCLETLDDFIKN